MKNREDLCNEIFGKDAEEVLNFLKKVSPEKETFRYEKSLLNHTARLLIREINKSSVSKEPTNPGFWENRKQSLTDGFPNRPKNILYVIRLLNGTLSVPALEEPDYDFEFDGEIQDDDEDAFWEQLDKRREEWGY